ncbi:MAG: hypothetical protein JW834_02510 [Candidatus Diapherotrites archaeon]|nr:hypothetical protein [Candidatus Diapherotrites archaeon]
MKYYDLLASHEVRSVLQSLGFGAGDGVVVDDARRAPAGVVCFVRGGSLELNRLVVRSKAHVLLDPIADGKMSVDSAVVQVAKDNGVAFGISLAQFLRVSRSRRAHLINAYRRLVQLCTRMGARIVLVSDARDAFGIRSPVQLVSLGVLLGLSVNQAKWSVSEVPAYLLGEVSVK